MATRNIVPRANGEGSIGTTAKHWGAGHFDTLPNWQEYLAESTGFGIVSGCEPTISGLVVTVGAGIVHLADGTRKELSATNITLDSADSTNPRIDLVYIDSTGTIAKITGTAASPSAPSVPSGGISVAQVSVAAGATTGTVNRYKQMIRHLTKSIYNVSDYGIFPDGTAVGDKLQSLTKFVNESGGGIIQFADGTYNLGCYLAGATPVNTIDVKSNVWYAGTGNTVLRGNNSNTLFYALFRNARYNEIVTNIKFENIVFDTYTNAVPDIANNGWNTAIVINSAKGVTIDNCTFRFNNRAIETRSGMSQQEVIDDRNAGNYHVEDWVITNNKFIFVINSYLNYYDNTAVALWGRNLDFSWNKFETEINTDNYHFLPNCAVDFQGQNVFVTDNIITGFSNAADVCAFDEYTGYRNLHFERNTVKTTRGIDAWNKNNHMSGLYIRDNLFLPVAKTEHNQVNAENMVALELRTDQSPNGYYENVYIQRNVFDYTNAFDYYDGMTSAEWDTWTPAVTEYKGWGGEYEQFFAVINTGAFTQQKDNIYIEDNTFIKSVFPCLFQSKSWARNMSFERNKLIDCSNGNKHYMTKFEDYGLGVSVSDNTVIDTSSGDTPAGNYFFDAQPGLYKDATNSRFFNYIILNNKTQRTNNTTPMSLNYNLTRLLLHELTQTIDCYVGNPNFTPHKPGLIIKKSNGDVYMSVGTSSSADWLKIN